MHGRATRAIWGSHSAYDELVREVTLQRGSIRATAIRFGVSLPTADGWVREAKPVQRIGSSAKEVNPDNVQQGSTFERLVQFSARESQLTARVGTVEIEVHAGFDGALLRSVMDVLQGGEA
jgi:transposase-like protein